MKRLISAVMIAALSIPGLSQAEELDQIFKRVNELVAQKNFPKAIEELQWAEKEIQKMNSSRVEGFFPDNVAGYTGNQIQNNTAMGFTSIERQYSKGGSKIKVALTGGSGQGAFGGLAALGKMAAMMGGAAGQDTMRISGRTAMVNPNAGSPELSIYLDSGSILMIAAVSNVAVSDLKAFAEQIKIDDLDRYLRGN